MERDGWIREEVILLQNPNGRIQTSSYLNCSGDLWTETRR